MTEYLVSWLIKDEEQINGLKSYGYSEERATEIVEAEDENEAIVLMLGYLFDNFDPTSDYYIENGIDAESMITDDNEFLIIENGKKVKLCYDFKAEPIHK